MTELNVQQQQQLNQYLKSNPGTTKDEALVLLFGNEFSQYVSGKGITIEKISGAEEDYMPSQIHEMKFKALDGKIYNINKALENRISNGINNLKKSEDENGFIGAAWSGLKNLTGLGDSSDKVRELQLDEQKLLAQFNISDSDREKIFEQLTGEKCTSENLEKFLRGEILLKSEQALNGYAEGQSMAVDIAGDVVSGVAAVGIYTVAVAAAPFTAGGSIAAGVAAAAASGALIKTGIKYADAKTGNRKYDSLGKDIISGGFSGILAPVTAGLGGAAGKTVAAKLGVQAVKNAGSKASAEVMESGIKHTLKNALINPAGYKYIGGNAFKNGLAYCAEMTVDGAAGGAVDNAFRTALDGGSASDIAEAAAEGFAGGALLSPVIAGGMKGAGKAGQKLAGVLGDTSADIVQTGNISKEVVESVVSTSAAKEEVKDVIQAVWIKNADGSDNNYAAMLMDLLWDNPSKLKRTLEACKKDGNFDNNLLKMACDLESNKIAPDNSAGFDGWTDGNNAREEMRVRMLSENVLNDNNLQLQKIDKTLNGEMQLDPKSKYKQLGVPVLNKRTNSYTYIFENLRDAADFNGLRGKNPLSGKNEKGLRFKLQKLQTYGITTIIDFRAEGECTKLASKVLDDLNIKYVNFPIDDLNWDQKAVKKIGIFLKAVNEDNFFAGCANGQARTDLGMAINYICNPSAKNIPQFYFNSSSSSRVSVTENLKQILNILKNDKELVKDWGWSDYDTFISSCGVRFENLKQSLSTSK